MAPKVPNLKRCYSIQLPFLAGILPIKTKGLANTQACKCTCKEFVLEREKLIYHFCSYKALGERGWGGCVGSHSRQQPLVFFPLAFKHLVVCFLPVQLLSWQKEIFSSLSHGPWARVNPQHITRDDEWWVDRKH